MSADDQRTTLLLDADMTAPAHARRAVRAAVSGAGLVADVVDLAVLLTSELVTNALVHGEGRPALNVIAGPTGARVSVSDESWAPPVIGVVRDDALGGRGLAIVDAWADAWDVTYTAMGKTVWFEVRSA